MSTVVSESPDLQQWYYDLLAVAVPKVPHASRTTEASRNRSVTFGSDVGDRSEGGPSGEDNGGAEDVLARAHQSLCEPRDDTRACRNPRLS